MYEVYLNLGNKFNFKELFEKSIKINVYFLDYEILKELL